MIDTADFARLREEMEHFDGQRETVIKRSRGGFFAFSISPSSLHTYADAAEGRYKALPAPK
jgi:hypothetical protein